MRNDGTNQMMNIPEIASALIIRGHIGRNIHDLALSQHSRLRGIGQPSFL